MYQYYFLKLSLTNYCDSAYNYSVNQVNSVNYFGRKSTMGVKERRNNEKKEMKKRIMTATIQIIEEEGYEKLSIRKIADKIEYSPTTIYLYYKDKAEIIHDMSNKIYSKVLKNIAADSNDSDAPDQQLCDLMSGFIKGFCTELEMARAIIHSGLGIIFSNDPIGQKPSNSGLSNSDEIIQKGIDLGIFRPDATGTSWMLVSALIGFLMCAIENKLYDRNDFEQLTKDFVGILLRGIAL